MREDDTASGVPVTGGEDAPEESAAAPATGRPRDPDLTERAMVTALEIYGREGWSGFTFGKVAVRARIGKSSLYLRWSSKGELLLAAFRWAESFQSATIEEDTPYLEIVMDQMRHRLRSYFGRNGLAMMRLHVEVLAGPTTIQEVWDASMGASVRRTRALLKRGIARGDLVPETSIVALGDALEGGCMMHALATPHHLRPRVEAGLEDFAVDFTRRTLGPWLVSGMPD